MMHDTGSMIRDMDLANGSHQPVTCIVHHASPQTLTVNEAIRDAAETFARAGIATARLDAEVLLSDILKKNRVWLITHSRDTVFADDLDRYREAVSRRQQREPLQYILGRQEFRGLDFIVTPDVLIPRPETELVVEAAVEIVQRSGMASLIIDLCTGSGCIAVSLANESASEVIFAVDTSGRALSVARGNAGKLGHSGRIRFFQGDLFDPLKELNIREQADIITANPPYVKTGDMPGLQKEVRDYEPEMALIAGPEGTEIQKRIIASAPDFMKKNGSLIMEMGMGQAESLVKMTEATGAYARPEIMKDLAGIDRVIVAKKL